MVFGLAWVARRSRGEPWVDLAGVASVMRLVGEWEAPVRVGPAAAVWLVVVLIDVLGAVEIMSGWGCHRSSDNDFLIPGYTTLPLRCRFRWLLL